MLRRLLPLLAVVPLAMMLGGCFQFSDPAAPGLPGRVPRDCSRFFVKVPDPGAKEGQDLGDIAAGYKGAWRKANKRLGIGGSCINDQAEAIERGAQ